MTALGQQKRSRVPLYLDLLGSIPARWPSAMVRLGRLESKYLEFDLEDVAIDRPVFIAGLPRSGTTILAEVLAAHEATASPQYRDYPFVNAPVVWHYLRKAAPQSTRRVERSHCDGLRVSLRSPEAIDEMIWMSFFEGLHDSTRSNVLDADTVNPEFAEFYRASIRKLLLIRRATRFFAKNNANVARLGYIRSILPDARFVIPVRDPVAQVASMVKQDRLFRAVQSGDPRSRRYARRLGHFEFGADFVPINLGDTPTASTIEAYHRAGDPARCYAAYWAATYGFLAEQLDRDPELAASALIVHYDELTGDPGRIISRLAGFCDLDEDRGMSDWAQHVGPPSYYEPDFDEPTRALIREWTEPVHARFRTGTWGEMS